MSEPRTKSKENNQERQAQPYAVSASQVPPNDQQGIGAILPVDDRSDVTGFANDAEDRSPPGSDPAAYREAEAAWTITSFNPDTPHDVLMIDPARKPSNPSPTVPDVVQWPYKWMSPATELDGATMPESSELAVNLAGLPADPPVRQATRALGLTPTITARCDTVTVLVAAPFDAWYDQCMLQVDNDAVDLDSVDYFDDAVRLFAPAASRIALAALRAHLDAHAATYAAAGVTRLVEPLVAQVDQIVCLLGVFATMHKDGAGRRENGELSFVETIAHDALRVPAYRAPESPFPATIFAPGDPFFSAVDDSAQLSDAALSEVKAHPEQYALVDLQVTTLYARVKLLGQAGDDAATQALTA